MLCLQYIYIYIFPLPLPLVDTPLKLLDNYLRNRHQFVELNNNSDLQEILTGILQGSILGPLIFSTYINDLIKSTNKFT